jgi:hypothetical protein
MKLSKERLIKIASWRETYGSGHNVVIPAEEAEAMAHELLKKDIQSQPVYQERRYQFIGKKQLEYWADIDRSTFNYLPKSERRIICIMGQED